MPSTEAPRRVALQPAQAFAMAQQLHRQGDLDAAEALYERLIGSAPRHASALHFMGVLQHQRHRSERALALIRRSIALDAKVPGWHNNLGNVLLELRQLDAAADAYQTAARIGPDRADVFNNLGVLRREQQRYPDAEAAYRRALALDPQYADALSNLGRLLYGIGRVEESLDAYWRAVTLRPRHAQTRMTLGIAYYRLGRLDEAVNVFREWLADEPDSPEARHHLAACSGQAVPGRAADAYVETVFDSFADSFDAKLAMLHYRAPELIGEAVQALFGEGARALRVIDAGCGTGLCGPLLAPYAVRLDGVDLSSGMLAKAALRQIYDGLHKAELTAFIEGREAGACDLIVSADTLCYFGALEPVAHACRRALAAGGWLVFTVEALATGSAGFHLNPHGRYSHRADYLRTVLADAGFAHIGLQAVELRMEGAQPVAGWVATAQVPSGPATASD